MPPHSKRQKQLERAREIKKNKQNEKQDEVEAASHFIAKADPSIMCFQAICTGTGYKDQAKIMLMQNIKPPASSTFYEKQKIVSKQLIDETKEQCAIEASKIADHAHLSADGVWNHPRNGSAATVTVIDNNRDKVVAYHTVLKSNGKMIGNFSGPSNMMETEGMKSVIKQLEPHISDKQIFLTHDNDNKTSKLIAQSNLHITDALDPGHSTQSIERTAKAFFEKCADALYQEANKDVLESRHAENTVPQLRQRGRVKGTIPKSTFMKPYSVLIQKLKLWFNFLIRNVPDIEMRKKMWLNSANHFLGIHSDCIHPEMLHNKKPGRPKIKESKNEFWEWTEGKNDEILVSQLIFFLEQTADRLTQISDTSTQSNESLNATIAKYCPKNRTFSASVGARTSLAIGTKNDPFFQTRFLKKHFEGKICNEALIRLCKMEEEYANARIEKKDPRFIIKRNELRKQFQATLKTTLGDYKKDMIF